jgi:hypothetical protein
MNTTQILWTWYACVMLVFNIAKGAALAVTRIAYMVLLNLCQVAIVDKTVFPAGTEGMDPAYASFMGTVHFASKYRHPILTSLFLRFFEERAAAQAHTASDTDERALEEIGLACHLGDGNERAAPRESQNVGHAMSLRSDMLVSNMVWRESGTLSSLSLTAIPSPDRDPAPPLLPTDRDAVFSQTWRNPMTQDNHLNTCRDSSSTSSLRAYHKLI